MRFLKRFHKHHWVFQARYLGGCGMGSERFHLYKCRCGLWLEGVGSTNEKNAMEMDMKQLHNNDPRENDHSFVGYMK